MPDFETLFVAVLLVLPLRQKFDPRRHLLVTIVGNLPSGCLRTGLVQGREEVDSNLLSDSDCVFEAGLDVLDSAPVELFGVELFVEHVGDFAIWQHFRQARHVVWPHVCTQKLGVVFIAILHDHCRCVLDICHFGIVVRF